ncbi:hypothetical protein [Pararhizobium sp. IMCC21322]|uniref:hypothetical protein n=1 Tax=Pararhizobium sp. IMCC21322 TaxID=3067903 RepID=UPI002740DB1F|nr:hypothetical protein [Pararhizobium sp. IMCC21322]
MSSRTPPVDPSQVRQTLELKYAPSLREQPNPGTGPQGPAPYGKGGTGVGLNGRKTDAQTIEETKTWMTRELPCVAGRRELNRGRYMVRSATKANVPEIFADFKTQLEQGSVVACLYVFNDPRYYEGSSQTSDVFHFLAEQMQGITQVKARDLANGAALTNSVELRCPVTNQRTLYDDFESIAFCPQSGVKSDMLYDPLMFAPFASVNMSSDVYAFSKFVADSALSSIGKPVYEETDTTRVSRLFSQCVARWQRVATTTIRNYEAMTDTAICPVHVTDDEKYWIAFHKDPAFAEQKKEIHRHELPVGYGTRITDRWLRYFEGDTEFVASGLARDGERV